MKKIILMIMAILLLTSCSTENQEREYEIVFENRLTEEGYYNGPLVYTQERDEFERRERNWDKKIDTFYSNNE
jgi:hypothetical protein